MSRITPRGSDVTGRFGEKYHSRPGMIHGQTDRPRNHVLCVAKWYGAKYALGAEGILNSCVFSFSSLAATQAGHVREERRRSAHFEPVTFFNCFIIYGRGGTLVIDPSLPGPIPLPPPSLPLSLSLSLSLSLFPPAVLRPRRKISIWLLTHKMSAAAAMAAASTAAAACDQFERVGDGNSGGNWSYTTIHSSLDISFLISLPSILSSIAHFAASDPRQDAILLIEPARALVLRDGAISLRDGMRVARGGRSAQRIEMAFSPFSHSAAAWWSLGRSSLNSIVPSAVRSFLHLQ